MLSDKVILLGKATALEEHSSVAQAKLFEFLKNNDLEDSCTLSILGKSTKNPRHFLAYEVWESKKAWHDHLQSPRVEEFYRDSKKFFSDIHFTLYTPFLDTLNVCKYVHIKAYENSIVAFGTIHAQKGKEAQARQDVTACISRNKEEKGCLYSALHIEQNNAEQLMGYEIWESQQAWIQHLQQPHVTAMTEQLPNIAQSSIIETFKIIPLL